MSKTEIIGIGIITIMLIVTFKVVVHKIIVYKKCRKLEKKMLSDLEKLNIKLGIGDIVCHGIAEGEEAIAKLREV